MDNTGRIFDERDNLEFELGEGNRVSLVEGVEQALLKFKKDEKSRLQLKSNKAFGVKGNAQFAIDPNTDLTYEIELKSFEKAKESWQLNSSEKLEQSELLKNKGTELFKVLLTKRQLLFFLLKLSKSVKLLKTN